MQKRDDTFKAETDGLLVKVVWKRKGMNDE